MKVWLAQRFGEPADILQLRDMALPAMGDDSVMIAVQAVGLNFLDAMVCRDSYPLRPALPFIPGVELVGRVQAVRGQAEFSVGQRVVAIQPGASGALAERVVVAAQYVYPLSDAIADPVAAGMLVTYQTAHFALQRANLQAGEVLLVHGGAGGVGTAAIQLGRVAGARVVATAGSPAKLDICRQQGAEFAIDYRRGDFAAAVLEASAGRGADVVVDQIGGDVFRRSLACLAVGGRIVPVGWASGSVPAVSLEALVAKNQTVVGLSWGAAYPAQKRDCVLTVHRRIQTLLQTGAIRMRLAEVVDFSRAPLLLQRLGDGLTAGKTVVTLKSPGNAGI